MVSDEETNAFDECATLRTPLLNTFAVFSAASSNQNLCFCWGLGLVVGSSSLRFLPKGNHFCLGGPGGFQVQQLRVGYRIYTKCPLQTYSHPGHRTIKTRKVWSKA